MIKITTLSIAALHDVYDLADRRKAAWIQAVKDLHLENIRPSQGDNYIM